MYIRESVTSSVESENRFPSELSDVTVFRKGSSEVEVCWNPAMWDKKMKRIKSMECRIPVITKCFDCDNCIRSVKKKMYCSVIEKIIEDPEKIDSECPYPKYVPPCQHVFKILNKTSVICIKCNSEYLLKNENK